MRETIVRTEQVYEGRVVKLDRLEVRLPDGNMAWRELVRHPGAVAIVALDERQQVLLVRQFRIAAGRVLTEIPAGTLEPGEAPDACAERELQEETGYRPGRLEALGGFYPAPGYTTEYIHLFLATDLDESRLDADTDEYIEVDRMPLANALALIARGEMVDGKSIIGLMLVASRFGLI